MSRGTFAYCHRCGAGRAFRKPAADHRRHLRNTIRTAGLWAIAWAALTVRRAFRSRRCTGCGTRFVAGEFKVKFLPALPHWDDLRASHSLNTPAEPIAAAPARDERPPVRALDSPLLDCAPDAQPL